MKAFARGCLIAALWILARALALADAGTHADTTVNFNAAPCAVQTHAQVFFMRAGFTEGDMGTPAGFRCRDVATGSTGTPAPSASNHGRGYAR